MKRVVIGFRIISLMERSFDVARVEAENPQAHLIIQPDGATNIPRAESRTAARRAETILDLRIGKFDLANGVVVAERRAARASTRRGTRAERISRRRLAYNRTRRTAI